MTPPLEHTHFITSTVTNVATATASFATRINASLQGSCRRCSTKLDMDVPTYGCWFDEAKAEPVSRMGVELGMPRQAPRPAPYRPQPDRSCLANNFVRNMALGAI